MICKYTPIPIAPRTFMIEERTPVSVSLCFLLLGNDRALLIDTGMSLGNIRKAVDSVTSLPVTVVNTHAHLDHMGSNFRFPEIYYHEDDRDVFALHTDPEYVFELLKTEVSPSLLKPFAPIVKRALKINTRGNYHTIRDGYVFSLGGREVEVIHTPGHSLGSVCLLERNTRMLFSGDTICGSGILMDLEGGSSPELYRDSVARLLSLLPEFDTIWPGHHRAPLDKNVLEHFYACANSVVEGSCELLPDRNRTVAKCSGITISLFPEQVQRIRQIQSAAFQK